MGAFGGDHHIRATWCRSPPSAPQQRVRPFAGQDVVVIGDTPNDIACGRAAGARTVAVATGPFSVAELHEHGADVVLESLADTEAAVAAILGSR